MWNPDVRALQPGVTTYRLRQNGNVLSFLEVLKLWEQEPEFCQFFSQLLIDSPYRAFRWETPPVVRQNIDRQFEFTLVDCPALNRPANPSPFASHFGDQTVVSFPNLPGDAILVVPCPVDPVVDYAHLASFLRTADPNQQSQLWQSVARSMLLRISDDPVWLSTAGSGVAWLHLRLDSRPKYYWHAEYRR